VEGYADAKLFQGGAGIDESRGKSTVAQVVVGKSNVSYRKAYLNPLLSLDQLIKSTRQALKSRIQRWARASRREVTAASCASSRYQPPQARNITLEQARLLTLGSLGLDDKGNQFVQLLFPGSNNLETLQIDEVTAESAAAARYLA